MSGGRSSAGDGDDAIRDQDRLLPIANISRIMKRVLPEHAKMSKESKSSIQECVSEFIGFITSESSDRLIEDKRKTITGDDIIEAMKALGFDNYVEFLTIYLKKYRQSLKGGGKNALPPSPTHHQQQHNSHSHSNPSTIGANSNSAPNSKRGRKSHSNHQSNSSKSSSLSHASFSHTKQRGDEEDGGEEQEGEEDEEDEDEEEDDDDDDEEEDQAAKRSKKRRS